MDAIPDHNPFLVGDEDGRDDTAYLNPDGREVEVDLEGTIEGPVGRRDDGPAAIGQFALTVLRRDERLYLESLAEDATSGSRVEWKINNQWMSAADVPTNASKKQFRIRGMNAVALFKHAADAKIGDVYQVKVPLNPFAVADAAGDTCADDDTSLGLDNSIYWYRWLPANPRCTVATQEATITISKVLSATTPSSTVYPEYDQLMADNKLTVVLMYGQVDHGELQESDFGFRNIVRAGAWLRDAGFKEVAAPLGARWEKQLSGERLVQIDIYGPREYAGLDDTANFANFQRAISEHEVVSWTGHSLLGASDAWSRPVYPSFYQIFLYGGCLGYEYYVKPILAAKGGSWDKLDIVSSVVEVSVLASPEMAAVGALVRGIERGNKTNWRSILVKVRGEVGDSTFGVSGARDNCFAPTGSRCD